MAALVQSFPTQQSSPPVPLMQSRPQSSPNTLQSATQSQPGHTPQNHLTPRNMGGYANTNSNNSNSVGNGGYRSNYSTAPVAPYAFTSTPGLSNTKQPPALTLPKGGERMSPAGLLDSRNRYPASDSVSSSSSASSDPSLRDRQAPQASVVRPKEEAVSDGRLPLQPISTISVNLPLPPSISSPTSRPSPDRYRRANNGRAGSHTGQPGSGSAQPSGSGMSAVAALYNQPNRANSNPSLPPGGNVDGVGKMPFIGDYTGQLRSKSVDDIHTYQSPAAITNQQLMRNRRRSVGPDAFSPDSFQNFVRQEINSLSQKTNTQLSRPGSSTSGSVSGSTRSQVGTSSPNSNMHGHSRPGNGRTGSTDSSVSGNSSRPGSSKRNSIHSTTSNSGQGSTVSTHEINLAHVPPRGSSSDLNKRITAPSPLSKPVNMGPDAPSSGQAPSDLEANNGAAPKPSGSPAVNRLSALSDPPKGMKNRLRRAFSFGSAAELRKVSAANSLRGEEPGDKAKLRQERFLEEQEAEQARIAKRQEEAGLGEGIYSGQGSFFTGSTDNVSVSSTASSASIMIRKMGKGMKKSTRSLVGLFRPKSVVGVPAASAPITSEPSTGQVSMVTAEAVRGEVNVNADPHAQPGGGTGFPKLDRNSIDTGNQSLDQNVGLGVASDGEVARKSIVGTDRERAEVLAAVRKGILKRSGSSSPVAKPVDSNTGNVQVPSVLDSSGSENQRPQSGKQRADSLKIEGQDYFMSSPRFPAASSNSAPTSPASMSKYNVSFSPRITFHDAWPKTEYDRRGDIATCNRLTPMLAQQIKEELNTFKMEMDVHEQSKVYTHFF